MQHFIKLFVIAVSIIGGIITTNAQDFAKIDAASKTAPSAATKSVAKLAAYLNENAKTDLDKVRAYYVWITHNIDYDTKVFFSNKPNPKTKAIDALKSGKAVCQGYSELFKALCEYSNIPCQLISGYSKGYGFDPKRKLSSSDHAWNVVFVENKWQLIDATWGAGYLGPNRKYVQQFQEQFFLANPETFILKHLPTDPMWQLLPCPISIDSYLKSDTEITNELNAVTSICFQFNDTIEAYLKLNNIEQQVESAERAFRFNPKNFEVTGYAYLNLGYELSQDIQALYDAGQHKQALIENKQILAINKKAYYYLNKSKSEQAKQAAKICKQNIDLMEQNIKSLEKFLEAQ